MQASLDRHQQVFHCAPEWYAGDRGFYSAGNEDDCRKAGVSQICIPQLGQAEDRGAGDLRAQPGLPKGQRFRVGIEGRISVLFRGRGMKRCRAEGRKRFEILAGAAVLANHLLRIPALLRNQKPARRSQAA